MKNFESIDTSALDNVTGGNAAQNTAWRNLQHRWGTTSGILSKTPDRQRFSINPLWGGDKEKRAFSIFHSADGHVHAVSRPL